MTGSPHELINPEELPPPVGYAHAVAPADGRTIYLGGQAGHRADGTISEELVEQFDQACANVLAALGAAGGEPEHLVALQIFVTDVDEYVAASRPIGEAYRRHFGKHYPAMALLGVSRLYDPEARVELVGTAVVPGG